MRRRANLFVTAVLVLVGAAPGFGADPDEIRLDPLLRPLLRAQQAASRGALDAPLASRRGLDLLRRVAGAPDASGSGASLGRAREPRLSLIVKHGGDSASLEAVGFRVHARIGSIVTGSLEPDRLGELLRLPEVGYVQASRQLLATLSPPRGAGAARLSPASRPADAPASGLTGAGALIAYVDTGVDIFHQDFRTGSGQTRIKYLLDLSDPGDVDGDGDLDGSGPFGGTLYSQADIDLALTGAGLVAQRDSTGHGSHGLSIAAGDDPATPGIAPAADLIVVKATRHDGTLSFDSGDLVNALAFVDEKARELARPFVVNLSLGTLFSSHDGRSLEEQAIDALVGPGVPGKAVVVAAGNSSENRSGRFHHVRGVANVGLETDHTLTIPGYTPNDGRGNDRVVLDFWYEGRDKQTIVVRPPASRPDCPSVTAVHGDFADVSTPCGDVFIGNMGGANAINGDTEALVLIDDWSGPAPAAGDWTVAVLGEEAQAGGEYHGWLADESQVGTQEPYFSANADNLFLVGKPATAYNAISAGSFARHDAAASSRFKTSWTDVHGIARSDATAVLGDVSDFSSPGFTRDGRVKPELMAPGERVLGAVSRDAYPGVAPNSIYRFHPFAEPAALVVDNTADHGFGLLQGTSFAAPVVTGVVARILSTNPALDAIQVRNILVNSALADAFVTAGGTQPVPNPTWGYGKLDDTVGAAPLPSDLRIVTDRLPDGVRNRQYNAVLTASGGTLPYAWALTGGVLPAGLTFQNALLSGKPTSAGSFTFTIQVSDGASRSASKTFTIQVTTLPALEIVTTALPVARIGRSYEEVLEADGGTPPYSWDVVGGNLPAGLDLLGNGAVRGVPDALGRFHFTARVEDATGAMALRSLSVRVSSESGEDWEPLGKSTPTVNQIAIDPNQPERVAASTRNIDAVFETTNGGESWRPTSINNNFNSYAKQLRFSPGSVPWAIHSDDANVFLFDRATDRWLLRSSVPGYQPYGGVSALGFDGPDRALAVAEHYDLNQAGLYRTSDSGLSWQRVGAQCGGGSNGDTSGFYGSLSVFEPDPSHMYLARRNGTCITEDRGVTWTDVSNLTGGGREIRVSQRDPFDVFKGPNWHSLDGGRNWLPAAGIAGSFYSLDRSATQPAVVFVGTDQGLFKSSDNGQVFRRVPIKGGNPPVTSVAIDPSDADNVYAGTDLGIFRTRDGGQTWTLRNTGLIRRVLSAVSISRQAPDELLLGSAEGPFLSRTAGGAWTLSKQGIATADLNIHRASVSPADANLMYLANNTGVMRSENRGITWTEPGPALDAGGFSVIDVEADPFDANVVIASLNGTRGTYRSSDRGAVWSAVNTGLPFVEPTDLAPARDVPGRYYLAFNNRGVYRTENRGNSWTSFGLNGNTVAAVAPAPSNSNQVYAAVGASILYREPGGADWVIATTNPVRPILCLAVDPANPQVAYAGADHSGVAGEVGGVYKTTDGGRNWARLQSVLDSFDVVSLATHPTASGIVYAATLNGGIYRTSDGGLSWTELANYGTVADLTNVNLPDPSNPSLLFAGTEGYGVQASADKGRTYVPRVNGLGNLFVNTIAFDPESSSRLYAGTDNGLFRSLDGGSLWTPTAQASGEITDIVTDTVGTTREIWATVKGLGVAHSTDGGTTFTLSTAGLASLELTSLEIGHVGTTREIWATTRGGDGVVFSTDGGLTWRSAAGNGLTDRNVNDLMIQRARTREIWATTREIWATTDSGVFVSRDDGASWSERSLGLPGSIPVSSVAADPHTGEVLVSLFARDGGGVFRGGSLAGVWTPFNTGLNELRVKRLTRDSGRVLDAQTNATTFYAATAGDGVYAADLKSNASQPVIVTHSLVGATLRSPYSAALVAHAGQPPYRWSVVRGALPPGVRLDAATGLLSGEPGQAGVFAFTVQVADSGGRTDQRELQIAVVNASIPSLSIGNASVTEGDSGTVAANFTVTLSAASSETVGVAYATANGTATAGSDYVATSGTLSFAPGVTSRTITVLVNGDTVPEPGETLFVSLSNPSNATIAVAQGIGTILDDDLPTLTIEDLSALEGDAGTTNFSFTVSLSAPGGSTITVDYATADNSALAGSDYVAAAGTLTFAPGQTSRSVVVGVNGDRDEEANERFFVNLSNPAGASISDGQALGTILDDDTLPRVSIADVRIAEGDAGTSNAVFTVSLSAPSANPISVSYQTVDATAKAGVDYTASSGTLVFPPGATTRTISVPVLGDTAENADRFFYVRLRPACCGVLYAANAGAAAIGTLSAYEIDAGNGALTPVAGSPFEAGQRAGAVAADPFGRFVFASQSWTNSIVSYRAAGKSRALVRTGSVTLAAGSGPSALVVDPAGRFVFAAYETANAVAAFAIDPSSGALTPVPGSPYAVPASPLALAVHPGGRFLYAGLADSVAAFRVDEASGGLTPVTGSPFATGGSTAIGVAFDAGGARLHVVNRGSGTISQLAVDATTGALTPATGSPYNPYGAGGPTLALRPGAFDPLGRYFYLGSDAYRDPTEHRLNGNGTLSWIRGCFTSACAWPGVAGVVSSLAVDPSSRFLYAARLSPDALKLYGIDQGTGGLNGLAQVEDPASIFFGVSEPGALAATNVPPDYVLAGGSATGTITDDDGPGISIEDASAVEGAAAVVFNVTLSAPSVQEVSVQFATSDGSALAGVHYKATSGTVVFPPGELTRTIAVPLTFPDDTIDQPPLGFFVTLSSPTAATIGDGVATGTILDNDTRRLSINSPTFAEGNAGTANGVFTVSLDAASVRTITVDYTTVPGTAAAGVDYQTTSGTLTFAPGTTSRTIAVPIVGNLVDDSNRAFSIALSNPANARIADRQGPLDATWTQLLTPPFQRDLGVRVVYDRATDRLIVYGGYAPNQGLYPTDIQVLENASANDASTRWVALTPSGTAPAGRSEHVCVYDPATNRLIVHGGTSGNFAATGRETWVLTGANGLGSAQWIRLPDYPGNPHAEMAAAYDQASNRMIVFGGNAADIGYQNLVWVLKDANGIGSPEWIQLTPGGAAPHIRGGRVGSYDPGSNRMIVFGGNGGPGSSANPQGYDNDVWILTHANGQGGVPAWIPLAPDGVAPTKRYQHATAFDPQTNRLYVFGGHKGSFGSIVGEITLGDTWLLSGANGLGETPRWVQAPISGPGARRVGGSASGDPAALLVFGGDGWTGGTQYVRYNDLWQLKDIPAGTGTIVDDDPAPTVSVNDVSVVEGDTGLTNAVFTVSLSGPSARRIDVSYATADGSARSGPDYVATTGSVSIPAGSTSATFSVAVKGDVFLESDETFFVNLTSASNAVIGDGQGIGTILNDDVPSANAPVPALQSIDPVAAAPGAAGFELRVFGSNLIPSSVVRWNGSARPTSFVSARELRATIAAADVASAGTARVTIFTPAPGGGASPALPFVVRPSSAGVSFTRAELDLAVGSRPIFVAAGDVNGDGKSDLVTANAETDSVSVFLGNGNATFAPRVDYPVGDGPQWVRLADLDKDGDLDLAVANYNSSNVSVLLNNGDGTFAPRVDYPVGAGNLRGVVSGDFNADGLLDLAAGGTNGVGVLLRNSDGTYLSPGYVSSPGFNFPMLEAADFNGDGRLDLLAATEGSGALLLAGNGEGVFTQTVANSHCCTGRLAAGDVNRDGALDYFFSSFYGGGREAQVFFGNNAGQFSGSGGSPGMPSPYFPAVADFNADGVLDSAWTNVNHGSFSLLLGSGNYSFATPTQFATGVNPYGAVAGDWNGDGRIDLATANYGSDTVSVFTNVAPPSLSVADISINEGNLGPADATFTVTLSAPSVATVSVSYATADGTATAGSDYVAASGTLTFLPNETSRSVTVTVFGDTTYEPNETFFLNLSSPNGATLARAQAQATIVNDDPGFIFSVSDGSVLEGNSGTTPAVFTVSMPVPVPSGQTFTVSYTTADGTASAGSDYMATSGVLTFSAGQSSRTVSVPVIGDTLDELDETFTLNLSGASGAVIGRGQGVATILDDDDAVVSVADVTVTEGNSGLTSAVFVVSLSAASARAIDVSYATADDTARAGPDYVAASGTVTIPAGSTSASVTVSVRGDRFFEPDETFFLNLTAAPAATIGDGQAECRILNDDLPSIDNPVPALHAIDPVSAAPGSAGFELRVLGANLLPSSVVRWNGADRATTFVSPRELRAAILGSDLATAGVAQVSVFSASPGGGRSERIGFVVSPPSVAVSFTRADLAAGDGPRSVATGDVNGDGRADLVVASFEDDTVSVFLGNGDGTFQPRVGYACGDGPVAIALGDFDKDGDLDIAVANANAGSVSVFLGNGSGGFAARADYDAGAQPSRVVAADFNADGSLDLAVGRSSEGVTVLLGNGDGTFLDAGYPSSTLGYGVSGLAAGDWNGDGRLDLLVGATQRGLLLLSGNNEGVFTTSVFYDYCCYEFPLAAADFNRDGALDVLWTNYYGGATSVSVSFGNNAGSQSGGSGSPALPSPSSPVVGDFNADGVLDSAWINRNHASVSLLLGSGNYSFQAPTQFATGTNPFGAASADFNGDGRLDLAVANFVSDTLSILTSAPPPALSVSDVVVAEGNSLVRDALFRVTLSPASVATVTVSYATADGTATAGSDYAFKSGTLTFLPGETTKTVAVGVFGDTLFEPDETFFLNLSGANGADIADSQGQATITNDDTGFALSVDDVSVVEGDTGSVDAVFTVSMPVAVPAGQSVSVSYATADGSATAGLDYQAASGTLTFAPGESSRTVAVALIPDLFDEPDETFSLNLANPSGALIVRGRGTATILDDDPTPSLAIDDVSVVEGNSVSTGALFTVRLSAPSNRSVSVTYQTANGTALAGVDYTAASGVLTFAPGATAQTLTVQVLGDTLQEADETFFVNLTSPVNATLGDGQGVGTILDDDLQTKAAITSPAPGSTLGGASVGFTWNSGNGAAQYWLSVANSLGGSDIYDASQGTSLSRTVSGLPVDGRPVYVRLWSLLGSGWQFADYVYSAASTTVKAQLTAPAPGSTLTTTSVGFAWSAGSGVSEYWLSVGTSLGGTNLYDASQGTSLSRTVSGIPLTGNAVYVRLWSLIGTAWKFSDSSFATAAPLPSLSIDDPPPVTEGNAGSVNVVFTVTLSSASASTVSVQYATANGTATAGSEYTATSGTLSFAPGETSKPIAVAVLGDTLVEGNETFFVNLTSPVNATIADGQGVATITDDDTTVSSLSINDVTVTEGNSGTTNAIFNVTLAPASAATVTVQYATANGTATAGSDYQPASGTLTFAPGETSKTITVLVNGDTTPEGNETFFVNLSNATGGATIGDGQGQGTITDDDAPPQVLSASPSCVLASGSRGVAVTVAGGPGHRGDWVGQFLAGAGNGAYLDWWYLSGTKTQPAAGLVNATLNVTMPSASGSYEFRLFSGASGAVVATSNAVSVSGSCITAPSLSINDVSVTEGDTGSVSANFTVTLSPAATGVVTVDYATSNGTATAGSDYTVTSGTLTFAAGETTKTITVPVLGDTLAEGTETFNVNLSNASGGAVIGDGLGVGTILDNDAPASGLVATPACVLASGTRIVAVSLTGGPGNPGDWIGVYATSGGSYLDWWYLNGTQTIPSTGTASANLNVTMPASPGSYEFKLVNGATGAFAFTSNPVSVGTSCGPSLSINDVTVTEGNSGTTNAVFSVTLSPAAAVTVTVQYVTANGTATAGSDYQSASGTLTFAPGETIKTITVLVNGDTTPEANETFFVNLSNATGGATIGDGQGQGTITNDDGAAQVLSASPACVTSGGSRSVTLTVTGGPGHPGDWVGLFATGAGNGAYLDWWYLSGTRTQPGSGLANASFGVTMPATTGSYEFRMFGGVTGAVVHTSNSVSVGSSCGPGLSVEDVTLVEGDAGTSLARFTVLLLPASIYPVTVEYETQDGTAVAGSDYQATSGVLSFAPGETAKLVSVVVYGDSEQESDETFALRLRNPSRADVMERPDGGSGGVAVIRDDDGVPLSLTASPACVASGGIATLTVAAGPGHPGDWIGLFAAGAADGAYLDWWYLDGSKAYPASGLRDASLAVRLNALGGYQFRLFSGATGGKLATSDAVSVGPCSPAPAQLLSVSPGCVTVSGSRQVTASVQGGPGHAGDWLGLFEAGAPDSGYLDWWYLTGGKAYPAAGLASASLGVTMPPALSGYELRLFSGASGGRFATSNPVAVASTCEGPGRTGR